LVFGNFTYDLRGSCCKELRLPLFHGGFAVVLPRPLLGASKAVPTNKEEAMKRIRLMLLMDENSAVVYELAVAEEAECGLVAGPDDRMEPFKLGDKAMRLYIRDGKLLDPEDIELIMRWLYRSYIPVAEIVEVMPDDCDALTIH
jgi:hypothetical protein